MSRAWRYATHGSNESAVAGLCDARGVLAEGVPSHWRIYVGTAHLERSLQTVRDLGGAVLDGPVDSPFGRLSTIGDPQGATFQVIEVDRPQA